MELVLLDRLFGECRNLLFGLSLCVRKHRRKATCLFCHQAIVKSATEFPFCGRHDPFAIGKMAIGIGRREFISVFGGSTAA